MNKKLGFSIGLILLVIYPVFQSHAGRETGNGGYGVVCFKNAITKRQVELASLLHPDEDPFTPEILSEIISVTALDLYYAQDSRLVGDPNPIIETNSSRDQILAERLDLLSMKSNYALALAEAKNTIPLEKWTALKSKALDTKNSKNKLAKYDTGHNSTFPSNCLLAIIARQDKIQNLTIVRVAKHLFNLMDSVNQAALVLHEWLYWIALRNNHEDSSAAQLMVAYLLDKNFAKTTTSEFNKMAKSLNLVPKDFVLDLPTFKIVEPLFFTTKDGTELHAQMTKISYDDTKATWFYLDTILYYESTGYPHEITLFEDQEINDLKFLAKTYLSFYENGRVKSGTFSEPRFINGYLISSREPVDFYASGKLKSFLPVRPSIKVGELQCNGRVTLFERGNVQRCTVESYSVPEYEKFNRKLLIVSGDTVFSEDGKVLESTLFEDFQMVQGLVKKGSRIAFDSFGRIQIISEVK